MKYMIKPRFLIMQARLKHLISKLDVLIRDIGIYELIFLQKGCKYLKLHNRIEKVAAGPNGHGYVCLWPFTSRLYAPQVWTYLGGKLLRLSIRDSEFKQQHERIGHSEEDLDISILIGHRGIERLSHLLCTISFFAGQEGVTLECIVIEQDITPRIRDYLPKWVRYEFMKSDSSASGYNRSAAFNQGVRVAQGRILLLHDNDMIVPKSYCSDILSLINRGYDVVNPKRFVFYLGKNDSIMVTNSFDHITLCDPEYIVQNLEAGGSMAITKEAYKHIGGMDERFIGWGGEDNEFWSRCSVLNRWIWGYAPVIHLWHPSQPLKEAKQNINISKSWDLISSSIDKRIGQLQITNNFKSAKKFKG
ncbi:MAG: glycosyltransferase family 2 protein [Cyanobacteriota bacterium]